MDRIRIRPHIGLVGAVSWLLLPALSAGLLEAQETDSVPPLAGLVRDASTGEPVRGAMVRTVDGRMVAISNRQGRFRARSMPSGTYEIEIGTSGFTSLRVMVTVPDPNVRTYELEPAPIDLGEIRVSVTARLEQRRRGTPSRVEAFDRAELEKAVAPDVGSFVKTRGIAQFVSCGEQFAPSDLPNCYRHRDGIRKLTVYIDDLQDTDGVGTRVLWAYDPRDLWSVEFLPECGELRIYTMEYRSRLAEGTATLRAVLCEPAAR